MGKMVIKWKANYFFKIVFLLGLPLSINNLQEYCSTWRKKCLRIENEDKKWAKIKGDILKQNCTQLTIAKMLEVQSTTLNRVNMNTKSRGCILSQFLPLSWEADTSFEKHLLFRGLLLNLWLSFLAAVSYSFQMTACLHQHSISADHRGWAGIN